MRNLLQITNLHKSFEGRKVLDGASMSLVSGTITLLTGDNGAGKTTLFNIITGVERADRGEVLFDDSVITSFPPLLIAQSGVARLYQTPRLFKNLLVWENLVCGAREKAGSQLINSVFRPRASRVQDHALKDQALSLLERFGLDNTAYTPVHELSFGQKKLVGLCILEMTECSLVLLDEPLAGLSMAMVGRVQDTIGELRALGKTFLIIEHDIDRTAVIADRQLRLEAGTIEELIPHG